MIKEPSSSARRTKPIIKPVNFGNVRRGESTTFSQYFFGMPGNYDLEVTNVSSRTRDIRVVRTDKEPRWECHTLAITFKAKIDESLGKYENTFRVYYRDKLNGPIKSVDVPVTGYIMSEITVSPNTLFFGLVTDERVTLSVALESAGKSIRIKEIANPVPNLEIEVTPTEKGQCLVAHLHGVPKGYHKWLLTIEIDNKDNPYVVIPVYAYSE